MAILKSLFSKPLKQNEYEKQLEEKVRKIKFEKESDYPFVSIIFPNWNGKNDTLECLDSLRKLNYAKSRMEIIISDNGSTDGSQAAIRQKYKEMKNEGWRNLKLIEIDENMGAPAACNKAIEQSEADSTYIWKLDNDVAVEPDSLVELVKVGMSNIKSGMLGGKIYYYDNPSQIWIIGAMFTHPWSSTIKSDVGGEFDQGQFAKIRKFDAIPGCCCLVKKILIKKIGLLDEDYFVYLDDTDWCFRARMANFEILYIPRAIIWHKVSRTTRSGSFFCAFHFIRSRILFAQKNYSIPDFLVFALTFVLWRIPPRFGRFALNFLRRKLKSLH